MHLRNLARKFINRRSCRRRVFLIRNSMEVKMSSKQDIDKMYASTPQIIMPNRAEQLFLARSTKSKRRLSYGAIAGLVLLMTAGAAVAKHTDPAKACTANTN